LRVLNRQIAAGSVIPRCRCHPSLVAMARWRVMRRGLEAGSYIPKTAVALRLARALQVRVEDLFTLPKSSPTPDFPSDHVALLPGSDPPSPGQPVQLCRVDERLVASVPSPVHCYLPACLRCDCDEQIAG
jgi:hypothetical protein